MRFSKLFTTTAIGCVGFSLGCGKSTTTVQKPTPASSLKQSAHSVSGKVTYNGEPVKYGYVLMYNQNAVDPRNGSNVPPKAAPIDSAGQYTITCPIVGPCVLCVATDPDVEPSTLMRGKSNSGATPGTGGPVPPGPPVPPGGMPPGGPPMPPGPPGGPPMPPGPPGGPPMPPNGGPGRPPVRPVPSPIRDKLTDEQKVVLREIHLKFGDRNASPFGFVVAGDADQVFDIALKITGEKPTSETPPTK